MLTSRFLKNRQSEKTELALPDKRVIVVGSTADYNEIIYKSYGHEVLFLTDINESLNWDGFKPPLDDECLSDLTDYNSAVDNLISHLNIFKKRPVGVACFDCESLPLAARIAVKLNLPFPAEDSINTCRSKAASHEAWQLKGIPCPVSTPIATTDDIPKAIIKTGLPAVLKPSTGSGSELTFLIHSVAEAKERFSFIEERLGKHPNTRMYFTSDCTLEKYIEGTEYSCDWILKDKKAEIIRIAKKLHKNSLSFGTSSAYIVPGDYEQNLDMENIKETLVRGANALGLYSMIAMTDFIMKDGVPYLLEITPRIGGDCLPWLIQASSDTDMFKIAIDYAKGETITPPTNWKLLSAVRIIADKAGIFDHVEAENDPRIIDIHVERKSGHKIILPPDNYDSRILGFVIFRPDSLSSIEEQARDIEASIRIVCR